jgi:hypothetical protein
MKTDEIRENALKHAVNNAASYEGKAQVGPVVGKILGEFPELRPRSQEVVAIVKEVVSGRGAPWRSAGPSSWRRGGKRRRRSSLHWRTSTGSRW